MLIYCGGVFFKRKGVAEFGTNAGYVAVQDTPAIAFEDAKIVKKGPRKFVRLEHQTGDVTKWPVR